MPGTEFTYICLLASRDGQHRYVGITTDLKDRIRRHNSGQVIHTDRLRPWRIQTAVAFDSTDRANAFDHYLKSHSGREWAKRHL